MYGQLHRSATTPQWRKELGGPKWPHYKDKKNVVTHWVYKKPRTLIGLHQMTKAAMSHRFMTFDESPYEMPPAIAPLEERGRMGYMVLIEGRQTGSSRLSVRVAHPAYKVCGILTVS